MNVTYNKNYAARTFNPKYSLYELGVTYAQQGAIYFACQNFHSLMSREEYERFRKLIFEVCNRKQVYADAVFKYLTSEYRGVECYRGIMSSRTFYKFIDEVYCGFNRYVKKVY